MNARDRIVSIVLDAALVAAGILIGITAAGGL